MSKLSRVSSLSMEWNRQFCMQDEEASEELCCNLQLLNNNGTGQKSYNESGIRIEI